MPSLSEIDCLIGQSEPSRNSLRLIPHDILVVFVDKERHLVVQLIEVEFKSLLFKSNLGLYHLSYLFYVVVD